MRRSFLSDCFSVGNWCRQTCCAWNFWFWWSVVDLRCNGQLIIAQWRLKRSYTHLLGAPKIWSISSTWFFTRKTKVKKGTAEQSGGGAACELSGYSRTLRVCTPLSPIHHPATPECPRFPIGFPLCKKPDRYDPFPLISVMFWKITINSICNAQREEDERKNVSRV